MADRTQAADDGWAWFASADEETYRVGPCATRDAALAEAIRAELGLDYAEPNEPRTVYLLEGLQDPINLAFHFDAEGAVEHLCETVDENYSGEDGQVTDGAWTKEQGKDLEVMLCATVAAWQAKHGIVIKPHLFTDTRNAESVTLPASGTAAAPAAETLGSAEGKGPAPQGRRPS